MLNSNANAGTGRRGSTASSINNIATDAETRSNAIRVVATLEELSRSVAHGQRTSSAVAKQACECLSALCFLSRSQVARVHIRNVSGRALISVFAAFSSEVRTLQGVCDLVWSMAYNDNEAQRMFAENHVSSNVLRCANQHSNDAHLIKSVLGAVSSLCRHGANQHIAALEGTPELVLNVIKKGAFEDLTLLQYSLDAVASLAHGHSGNAKVFADHGILKFVVESLHKHADSVEVARSASIVLVVMRETNDGCRKIVDLGGIQAVTEAARKHLDQAELQHIVCALVGQLIHQVPSAVQQLARCGGVSLLLTVLKRYFNHWMIAEASCVLLSTLTKEGRLLEVDQPMPRRTSDFTSDELDVVVEGNTNNFSTQNSNTDQSFEDLELLVQRNAESSDWSGLVAVAGAHRDRPALILSALRVLVNLSRFESSAMALKASGGVAAVLALLGRAPTSSSTHTRTSTDLHNVSVGQFSTASATGTRTKPLTTQREEGQVGDAVELENELLPLTVSVLASNAARVTSIVACANVCAFVSGPDSIESVQGLFDADSEYTVATIQEKRHESSQTEVEASAAGVLTLLLVAQASSTDILKALSRYAPNLMINPNESVVDTAEPPILQNEKAGPVMSEGEKDDRGRIFELIRVLFSFLSHEMLHYNHLRNHTSTMSTSSRIDQKLINSDSSLSSSSVHSGGSDRRTSASVSTRGSNAHEGVWSKLVTEALYWLRQCRHLPKPQTSTHLSSTSSNANSAIRETNVTSSSSSSSSGAGSNMVVSYSWTLVTALCRFLACSLQSQRSAALRAMASGGGVTLMLQLQRQCRDIRRNALKATHGGTQDSVLLKTLKDALLDSIVVVLRSIGNGSVSNAMPYSSASLTAAVARVQARKHAEAQRRRALTLEIISSNSSSSMATKSGFIAEGLDKIDSKLAQQEVNSSKLARKEEEEQQQEQNKLQQTEEQQQQQQQTKEKTDIIQVNSDNDGSITCRTLESDNSDGRRAPATSPTTVSEPSREEDAASANDNDNDNDDDTDHLSDTSSEDEEELSDGDEIVTPTSITIPTAAPTGTDDNFKATATNSGAAITTPIRVSPEDLQFPVPSNNNTPVDGSTPVRARANFVVELPPLIYDTPPALEPYTPESERLEPGVAQARSIAQEFNHTGRKLVYDWVQAGGQGEGIASSKCSPALPYEVESNVAHQDHSHNFLAQPLKNEFPVGPDGDHLLYFESRFESGNLLKAVRVSQWEYDLIMRSDIHTKAHHQWFYFAIANTHPPEMEDDAVRYKFNIVNFTKTSSMFTDGMKPVRYSFHDAFHKKTGWRRDGDDISYFPNSYPQPRKKKNSSAGTYHTLTFTMVFQHAHDTTLLAMCYPYTYTKLQRFLNSLEQEKRLDRVLRRGLLCHTPGGLRCDELTITDMNSPREEIASRRAVVLSARVHPGEVNASFMMHGTLVFLLGESPLAKLLRRKHVFKIVPMLNPDGVYHGNTRVSLSGFDLNRVWASPNVEHFPEIYYTKLMMRNLLAIRRVSMFVDFHGHSRKKSIFMYGVDNVCGGGGNNIGSGGNLGNTGGVGSGGDGTGSAFGSSFGNGGGSNVPSSGNNKRSPSTTIGVKSSYVREYPRLIAHSPHAAKVFSFEDCSFHVHKGHETAARVVVARELGIRASYTLEASFAGAGPGPLDESWNDFHFSPAGFKSIGVGLCDALLRFHDSVAHADLLMSNPGLGVVEPPRRIQVGRSGPASPSQSSSSSDKSKRKSNKLLLNNRRNVTRSVVARAPLPLTPNLLLHLDSVLGETGTGDDLAFRPDFSSIVSSDGVDPRKKRNALHGAKRKETNINSKDRRIDASSSFFKTLQQQARESVLPVPKNNDNKTGSTKTNLNKTRREKVPLSGYPVLFPESIMQQQQQQQQQQQHRNRGKATDGIVKSNRKSESQSSTTQIPLQPSSRRASVNSNTKRIAKRAGSNRGRNGSSSILKQKSGVKQSSKDPADDYCPVATTKKKKNKRSYGAANPKRKSSGTLSSSAGSSVYSSSPSSTGRGDSSNSSKRDGNTESVNSGTTVTVSTDNDVRKLSGRSNRSNSRRGNVEAILLARSNQLDAANNIDSPITSIRPGSSGGLVDHTNAALENAGSMRAGSGGGVGASSGSLSDFAYNKQFSKHGVDIETKSINNNNKDGNSGMSVHLCVPSAVLPGDGRPEGMDRNGFEQNVPGRRSGGVSNGIAASGRLDILNIGENRLGGDGLTPSSVSSNSVSTGGNLSKLRRPATPSEDARTAHTLPVLMGRVAINSHNSNN